MIPEHVQAELVRLQCQILSAAKRIEEIHQEYFLTQARGIPLKVCLTPDDIVDIWNSIAGKKAGYSPGLGGGKHRQNVLEAMGFLASRDDWQKLFHRALQSEFLMGQNERGWVMPLTWIVDYDNALRVMAGEFDNDRAVKTLFASMKTESA